MESPLAGLPSDHLLSRLHALVRRGNAVEAELLSHLGEVDARRLYLREACPSMFHYCVRVLLFAESVAYKRIAAARAARRHPEIRAALGRGDLHLTALSLLAPQLTTENCRELIASARHRTADEIRRRLADRQPKPDVPASVRRVPPLAAQRPPSAQNAVLPTAAATAPAPACAPTPAVKPPSPRAQSEPLGGERYCVRFTADRDLHAKLQELRALMRHQIPDGDLGKILAEAVSLLLERVRKRKFGEGTAPRAVRPSNPSNSSKPKPSRHIPAAIRRAVFKRDGGRCTYLSPRGQRCRAREFLEFHHHDPWAHARAHSINGIALRCRAHNQYEACRDFGERHMARFRTRERIEPSATPKKSVSGSSPRGPQLDLNPVRPEAPSSHSTQTRPTDGQGIASAAKKSMMRARVSGVPPTASR